MKMFVDSANLEEIEEAFKRGFPSGVTTNPSILSHEKKCDFKELIRKTKDNHLGWGEGNSSSQDM